LLKKEDKKLLRSKWMEIHRLTVIGKPLERIAASDAANGKIGD
jgi:hypothetical protein